MLVDHAHSLCHKAALSPALPLRLCCQFLITLITVYAVSFAETYAFGGAADLDSYKAEMALADKGPDRDTAIEHLRKALPYAPDDKARLAIEFRIAVGLQQYGDPKFPDQTPQPQEALKLYEAIVDHYRYADYYVSYLDNSATPPDIMILFAASQCGHISLFVNGDPAKARPYYLFVLDSLNETLARRVRDWQSVPYPVRGDENDSPTRRYEWRVASWYDLQRKASEGDVLSTPEMRQAQVVIETYVQSFGKQTADEIKKTLDAIISRYPNTPIAKMAQDFIDKAIEAENNAKKSASKPLATPPAKPVRTSAPGGVRHSPSPTASTPPRTSLPSPVARTNQPPLPADSGPSIPSCLPSVLAVLVVSAVVVFYIRSLAHGR